MRPFRSLSARLTVQFALLFAAAMLVVSAALFSLISDSASRQVASQLQSSGAVYDRLWQQRSRELQNAAQLLARDFGFREAVATGDRATMQSALGNAAARLKVRSAFIVTADGHVSGYGPAGETSGADLWGPLDEGCVSGVSVLGGRPRQLVAAPVLAPNLIGWVIFAGDLDTREMRGLEKHVFRCRRNARRVAAHDAAERDRRIGIGDQQELRIEFDFAFVVRQVIQQGWRRFTREPA